MKAKGKHPAWILRVSRAHKRLGISAVIGLAVIAALPSSLTWVTRLLLGWDTGVTLYLAAATAVIWHSTAAEIRRNAAAQDEGSLAMLVLSVIAAMASLGAIFAEAASADRAAPGYALSVTLTIATVVLSWAFIHTIFALHYAHEFYGAHSRAECLRFPGGGEPDYWDFVYFAFVIGMTFQVSDVTVTKKPVRRVVVTHGVLSFFFTTAIVALTVNIAAGVLQR